MTRSPTVALLGFVVGLLWLGCAGHRPLRSSRQALVGMLTTPPGARLGVVEVMPESRAPRARL